MATPAYSDWYLSDAQKVLSEAFDYGINQCLFPCATFAEIFASSDPCKHFERGHPMYVSGMSGVEFARTFLPEDACPGGRFPAPRYSVEKSPEYWAGWSLAYHQWATGLRFRDIFASVPLQKIIEMYPLFHEMDILRFTEELTRRGA